MLEINSNQPQTGLRVVTPLPPMNRPNAYETLNLPDATTLAGERRLRQDLFEFFALSELALMLTAVFGSDKRTTARARETIKLRRVVHIASSIARLPYTLPGMRLGVV